MSSELQRQDETPIRMADLSPEYAEIMVLGKVLQMSGYFRDVRDQAQAVTKILFGKELGISPINSMSAIHIIEGKPALSSNLLAALIKRSGKYDYRVKSWSDQECTLTFRQKMASPFREISVGEWEDLGESSFTIEDAKRAGVVKPGGSWSKYPKAMLFARALSQGERTYCPDVSVCALYVPEELGATVNESGEVEELPASRGVKEVTRTTEPIPIQRPPNGGQIAGRDRGKASGEAEGSGAMRPSSAPTEKDPAGSIKGKAGTEATPPIPATPAGDPIPALADALAKKVADPDATIALPKQRALHRAFKDAINPALQLSDSAKELIFRDWLKNETFIGPDGKGSTKGIPLLLFDETMRKAVNFGSNLR